VTCRSGLAIGAALAGLVGASFAGAWFQVVLNACSMPPTPDRSRVLPEECARYRTLGSLWNGIGVLPGAVLLVGILSYLLRRALRRGPALPVGEPAIRMAFGAAEAALLFVYWDIAKGYPDFSSPSSLPAAGPGWAFWVAAGLALLVGVGGGIQQRGGHRSHPAAFRAA
jgi:hypothetical protein